MDVPLRHQQLIARLIERGLVAEFRRWVMGDTISVADQVEVNQNGLESYNRHLYLYPVGENAWVIDTCFFFPGDCQSPPIDETEILEHVARLLASQDTYESESRRWHAEWRSRT